MTEQPTKKTAKTGALLQGSVGSAIREMSIPMLLGLVAMIVVNLVDTYWVSRLGTNALAAMSFTFPVESLVINISLGLMVGTSVIVARSVGAGDPQEARQITTDATVLAMMIVALVSATGLLFQDELFGLLGAEGDVLEDVKAYMTPWFIGVAFLVVPMIANGALRALGDAKTPMRVMMLGAAVNAVLDPLFIFGWGPMPALGLQGAAIATVIARFIAMVVVFWILIQRARLLSLVGISKERMLASWRRVAGVAVPAIITNAVGPLAVGILTGLVAQHGPAALAAWGIGARVDAVLLLAPFAVSGAVSPFVGQNWGAHLQARVSHGLRISLGFVLIWGAIGAALSMTLAPVLAGIFSDEPSVQASLVQYLRVVPVGYAFIGIVAICSSAFNAVDRATRSSVLSVLRSLGVAIPAALIGDHLAGMHGLLLGIVLASVTTAFIGVFWVRPLLFPLGRAPSGVGRPLRDVEIASWIQRQTHWASLSERFSQITDLDSLACYALSGDRLGVYVGARELAHLHPQGAMDLALPVEVGDNLSHQEIIRPHPTHPNDGWYRQQIQEAEQTETTVWLLGLTHLLYELSERGEADPITQQEMAAFTRTQRCVDAMRAAAKRWNALPSQEAK